MVAVVNQSNDKEEALAIFSQFCHCTVSNDTHEIVHYLLGEKFVGQIDILQQMMKEALNIEYTAHVCNIHIYRVNHNGCANVLPWEMSYRLQL